MRGLPSELQTELAKDAFTPALFLELLLDTPLRLCSFEERIYWSGAWWEARGIQHGGLNFVMGSAVDKARIEVDNTDDFCTAIILTQDYKGKACNLYSGVLDKNLQVISAFKIFPGIVDSISAPRDSTNSAWYVYNRLILGSKRPLREQTANCPWTWKNATYCKYAGVGAYCQQLFDNCVALGNDTNFGGERWLSKLEGQVIWWGKNPS